MSEIDSKVLVLGKDMREQCTARELVLVDLESNAEVVAIEAVHDFNVEACKVEEAADDVTNAESENDKFDMKIEYDYWSRESVL